MTRSDAQGAAVGISIVGAVAAFFMGLGYLENNSPKDCYADFAATYTWQHRLPEMKEMWADKRLTVAECAKTDEIYEEAKIEHQARETQEKINALGNI